MKQPNAPSRFMPPSPSSPGSFPALRVFYLTTEFLWPPHHGGRMRSLSQLRLLASIPELRVTCFGLTEVPVGAAELGALRAELPGVRVLPPVWHPIHLKQHPMYLGLVALHRLLGAPYLAGKWDSPSVRRAIQRLLQAERYDVVYVDHLGMARFLPEIRRLCPGAWVVLEEHNVESDFFGQFAERQRGPLRVLAQAEWRAARRFEREALRAADGVVAISDADAAALRELSGVEPVVVPQVVPISRRPALQAGGAPRLCYVGNLTWHPNVHGLDWFVREVWPLVLREVPAAELVIAGSGLKLDQDGKPVVPAAWQAPGIRTVGFVPDLGPFYAGALGFVAPIVGGSGVRIKLLEALRAGLPTVTTVHGAAGLPLEDGRQVLIADQPAAFAAKAVALCTDGALRERLREAGYAYLEARHGLAVAQEAMRRALGLSISSGSQ